MKLIFWGTPAFAVPILHELCQSQHHEVVAIVSQPDTVKGRKGKPQPPEVAQYGLEHNILVLQPEDLKEEDFIKKIQQLQPDVMVVVAYGRLLRKGILKMPRYGCINVHFSLLPKYRGASPVNAAILNGDKETGVTIMKMAFKLDAGPIYCQSRVTIRDNETTGQLLDRLSEVASKPLLETIDNIADLTPQPQDESQVSYCGIIDKKDGFIDWKKPASHIERLIRAMSPWPTAYSNLRRASSDKEERITIHAAQSELSTGIDHHAPGAVIQVDKKYIWVKTGEGVLKIIKLQRAGKAILNTEEFLRGVSVAEGDFFN